MALVALIVLGACSKMSELGDQFTELAQGLRALNEAEQAVGFMGIIAADEPRAALAGREVLAAGGNAVDAATAMYFNLAVTLPSSASLGGGGVCLVHDAQTNVTKVLDFLSTPSSQAASAQKRANAIPANVAGFYALHARYGRVPWTQLVAPAEGLARFGFRVSRAFSSDLQQIGNALLAEEDTRRVFADPASGNLIKEGDFWKQPYLAALLDSVRVDGAPAIYKNPGAEYFAESVRANGGALSAEDLINFKPVWRNPVTIPLGDISVHFAPPPAAGGAVAAEMLAMMLDNQRFSKTAPENRPHLFVEAALRAFADRGQWMRPDGSSKISASDIVAPSRMAQLMSSYRPDAHVTASSLKPAPGQIADDPSATSFAVMDVDGAAVACGLTTNGFFGNGLIARGTGVLMAFPPGSGGRGPFALGPMLAVDHFTNDLFFAAGASGGITAPTALMSVAMDNAVNVEGLESAMHAKRLHHSGEPDIVYYEQGYDEAVIEYLIKKGHRVAATPSLGKVNAVGCTQGYPFDPTSCEAVADPRGYGLAIKIDN